MIVLLTGGTGSFGRAFLRKVLPLGWVVRVFSRDEVKQFEQREELGDAGENVRWFLGDVRDSRRVARAVAGADLVVHAAALKRVDACEYNPSEAVRTNVDGTRNVLDACLDAGVPKAVLLSSDKAVHATNLYGKTKAVAESLWLAGNAYAGTDGPRFSAVRYGNVVGSRGSVAEQWARSTGMTLRLASPMVTRFWLNVDDAVSLVLTAVERMQGGELFVPKVGSSRVADLLPAGAQVSVTGLGVGEKLHEMLISEEEVSRAWDCGDHYVISSSRPRWAVGKVPEGFRYSSEVATAS